MNQQGSSINLNAKTVEHKTVEPKAVEHKVVEPKVVEHKTAKTNLKAIRRKRRDTVKRTVCPAGMRELMPG